MRHGEGEWGGDEGCCCCCCFVVGGGGQAFRTHVLSTSNLKPILSNAPRSCLDEYTESGRPAGVTPLHMIVGGADRSLERQEIVREFVRLKASVNMKHRTTGATPLLRAAGCGGPAMTKLLLDLLADPNIANNDGLTPLDAATKNNAEARV